MKIRFNKSLFIILAIILFVLILLTVSTILYQKNSTVRYFLDEYLFKKNISGDVLDSIYINDSSYSYAYNDAIVVLNQNTLTFYNKSGSELSNLEIKVSEPIFSSNGKYLCIAEKNGSEMYLIENKEISWQKTVNGDISCISVNKNGYVAIAISNTTYKTISKVYNDNGDELFTSYLSKSYIIDLSLSKNNKYLSIAEANFSGITVQSNIKIISIDNALSNSSNAIDYNYSAPSGDLIVNISYCDNNSLVCIYDNHIDIIKNNEINEIVNYDINTIKFADINNTLIQVEKKNNGLLSSEFVLQIIDLNNFEKKEYLLEKEPKSIYTFGNVIAINFGSEALFINNNAWLIKHYKASQEIKEIILSNNLAGIIYKDKIEILDL